MANKNETETLQIPVIRNGTSLDFVKMMAAANKVAEEYEAVDREASKATIEAVEKILSNEKWKDKTYFAPGTIGLMALAIMGEEPNPKMAAEAETRVRNYLQSQSDTFLRIRAGRNAGFHHKARLAAKDKAAFDKLVKESEASEAAWKAKHNQDDAAAE